MGGKLAQKGTLAIQVVVALLVVSSIGIPLPAQQRETEQSQSAHHSEMMKRGEQAMGFSQEETTHHFRLYKDGGAIEVVANDPKDTASRDQIRMHLSHIAKMFSAGNFEAPMFIHATTPPGVPTMTTLRDKSSMNFKRLITGLEYELPQPTHRLGMLFTLSCCTKL